MDEQFEQRKVEPNLGLAGSRAALPRYLLKRWDELTLFLRRAGAPLDTMSANGPSSAQSFTARILSSTGPPMAPRWVTST